MPARGRDGIGIDVYSRSIGGRQRPQATTQVSARGYSNGRHAAVGQGDYSRNPFVGRPGKFEPAASKMPLIRQADRRPEGRQATGMRVASTAGGQVVFRRYN